MKQGDNIVHNWSYDKPTEQGDYLVCCGDVEVEQSVSYQRFYFASSGITLGRKESLYDEDGACLDDYHSSCKYARLIYSPSELKRLDAGGEG
jgi:hypothetical protein